MDRERAGNDLLARFCGLPHGKALLARLGDDEDVYLVGGAVRDLILGRLPLDLDLVVDGDLAAVAASLGTATRVHDRFETRSLDIDGITCDLARARRETYDRAGALPTVAPAGIVEDLQRRDFTVNALALGLTGAARGRLVTVPGALADLEARRLRVLHDRSFIDDPTRLLRLARYAGRLSFTIEPHTRALAAGAVSGKALDTVSGSRLGMELRLLAAQPQAVAGFCVLDALGIDAALAPGFGIHDPERAQLADRAVALLPASGEPADVIIAVAALDVAPDALAEALDRLAFTATRRDRILAAATRAGALAGEMAAARAPSQIAAAVGAAPVEAVALAGALGAEGPARLWLEELRHVRLEISGSDLLAAGIAPGPAVGRGLAAARAAKLDGRADGRDGELGEALRAARGHG